jgi:hypothetical protein
LRSTPDHDPALLVDDVAFGLEERSLRRLVGAIELPVGRHQAPPREVGRMTEDVGHGLGAAGATDLRCDVAIADQIAGLEGGDGVDDRSLEPGRAVVVGPRGPVGRVGRVGHGDCQLPVESDPP